MKSWIAWCILLVLAVAAVWLPDVGDLPSREQWALANTLILSGFAAVGVAAWRVLRGQREWQRRLRAWAARPVTHWNDWRVIALLAGNALGFYFLTIADLPPGDKWSSASVLLLLTLCLAVQMVSVAFFKRDRK
jgi:hypothetical protein